MFKSRRLALVHRLWRSRAMGCEETAAAEAAASGDAAAAAAAEDDVTSANLTANIIRGSGEDDGPCRGRFCLCRCSREPPSEMKALATGLLKQLSLAQLESLTAAAESRGSAESGCVPLPNGEMVVGAQRVSTLLFVCRLLRWPDLRHPLELKRLCSCESFGRAAQEAHGPDTLCCNPFHLSRLCLPDSPPPPYTRFPPDSPKLQVGSAATFPSVETSSTELHWMPGLRGTFLPSDVRKNKPWCTLAYWEHKTRTGPLFHAYEQAVAVFYELPQGGDGGDDVTAAAAAARGLCLKQLPGTNGGSQTVRRTRARVGPGLLLSREPDGVWAYNRGEQPAFVHSPTLDAPGCPTPTGGGGGGGTRAQALCRVPSGHSVKVFDFEHARHLHKLLRADDGDRPRDVYSIRISFGKGWGREYSRQCVLDCPCWLEVFFYR